MQYTDVTTTMDALALNQLILIVPFLPKIFKIVQTPCSRNGKVFDPGHNETLYLVSSGKHIGSHWNRIFLSEP